MPLNAANAQAGSPATQLAFKSSACKWAPSHMFQQWGGACGGKRQAHTFFTATQARGAWRRGGIAQSAINVLLTSLYALNRFSLSRWFVICEVAPGGISQSKSAANCKRIKLFSSVCKVIFLSGGYRAARRRACHSQSDAPHRPEPCICKQVEGCHVLAVAAHKHISSTKHIWSLTILARTEMRNLGWKGAFRWMNKRRIECCTFYSFTLPVCHFLESTVAVIDSLWGLIKHTD